MKTYLVRVEVPNPRWHRCSCRSFGPNTFRPITSWLNGQTSPELLYLETKWASLIPYAKVVELLKDVLPVADTLNQETVRSHLHAIANRIEQGLGEESVRLFEGSDQDWEEQPLPDGPMTVGIDGGFVRAAHKAGWFEVIAARAWWRSAARKTTKRPRPNASAWFRLTMEAASPSVGVAEVARNAREPAGRLSLRWR